MRQNKNKFEQELENKTEIVKYRSGEVLDDKNVNGKKRPWRERKTENVKYADYLADLEFRKAKTVHECADNLFFHIDENGEKKLYQTWFCKSRLCPMCAWRRGLKVQIQMSKVLDEAVRQQPTAKFLFLTLTVRNVRSGHNLRIAMRHLTDSFRRFSKYKKFQDNIIGYVRSTEVTVNKDNGSYHPHIHVLLMVRSSYFKGKNYMKAEDWQTLWRKAAKLDYDPVIDIRKVTDKRGGNSLKNAALETAKYQTKSKDYLNDDVADCVNRQRLNDLEYALRDTRQFGFGGVLKEIAMQLKIDENDDDLVHVEGDDAESKNKIVRVCVAQFDYPKMNYYWK